jgi:hypothetical protein
MNSSLAEMLVLFSLFFFSFTELFLIDNFFVVLVEDLVLHSSDMHCMLREREGYIW